MTDTISVNKDASSLLGADVAAGVAQFLQPVVVNLQALGVDGKQAHWHVRGSNFIGVHEFLDVYVGHVQEWADLAAERVVALGLPVDARVQTLAAATTTPVLADGFQRTNATIAAVVSQIDTTLELIHQGITGLDDIDVSSQDVLIEIARGLEKDRWFLFAHIAEA
ncbi:Dps family protein [Naasia lichenicola]|uniref:DNA starvation/stationary phase protection protein n=1 Tax=Naasia lichenicola TaxID=2565933 RepID=A0A4S4FEQ9_9MICO|nr:DNA starvation/stationary phase protection protein [Naasia lichenicola]THG28650.1 DNA starvation/stationary phase protection protein [Naasia lichenicola]